ncbi:hypothetical protein ACFLTZ_03745, partial [Chloroflexota bacterium]
LYTNVVFAEDEEGLPPDWEPLNVSYWGHRRGANTVTIFGANSSINVGGGGAGLVKEEAQSALYRLAGFLKAPNSNYFTGGSYSEGCPGIVLIARGTAHGFSSVLGFSKDEVKTFLWENSKISWSEMKRTGLDRYVERIGIAAEEKTDPLPITRRPKNIMVVVAGGEQSGHSYYMAVGLGPAGPVIAEIELPAKWNELLRQAEEDLGPNNTRGAATRSV